MWTRLGKEKAAFPSGLGGGDVHEQCWPRPWGRKKASLGAQINHVSAWGKAVCGPEYCQGAPQAPPGPLYASEGPLLPQLKSNH